MSSAIVRYLTLSLLVCAPAGTLGAAKVGSSPPTAVVATADVDLPTYSYVLSGGDRLRIVVFGDQTLGGEFTISGSGFVSLPLIGEVDVRGLTSTQLQARIAARLADGYLKDPRVAIEVLSTRPYYILGEVNKPGQYPFADGLTVLGAVAQAGGFTYRAKTGRVFIKHAGEQTESSYPVTASALVAPGDTMRVKERWF